MKILTLDYRSLYKQVTEKYNYPFYQWNEWIKDIVEKLQFEYIYKKKNIILKIKGYIKKNTKIKTVSISSPNPLN